MNATRFVVAPSSDPCHHEIRAQRRNAPSPVGAASFPRSVASRNIGNPSTRVFSVRARPKLVVLSWRAEHVGERAASEPSLGRRNGLGRPIGHIGNYRFAARNPRARADSGRARLTTVAARTTGEWTGRTGGRRGGRAGAHRFPPDSLNFGGENLGSV